ncbi:MAG TPA: polysaccharide deacetylase family protein [Gemmatimonadaceae bacterium]|nr:polysaccharide deacetylase family protein [Gemmatimonadaceae bacterium]
MRNRWLRRAAMLGLVALTAVAVAWTGWQLSKSRRYQLFGDLVTRVETADSVVALTFDDGPVPRYTDSVLAILADSGVRATFFTIGAALRDHPDIAVRIARAGHELGNHSFSHKRLVLKSPGYVRREIRTTDSLIRSTGYDGTIHFRPPYGKRLVILPWILSRHDRPVILADLEPDSNPATAVDAARMVDHVSSNVRPGSIILMHVEMPSRSTGREALPSLIGALHSQGYRFVTVSELMRRGPHS